MNVQMGYALTLRSGSLLGNFFGRSKEEVKRQLYAPWLQTMPAWVIVPAVRRADGSIKIIG